MRVVPVSITAFWFDPLRVMGVPVLVPKAVIGMVQS
jgi:hypothetical protein